MTTRRRFLEIAGAGGVGVSLLGCGDDGAMADSALPDGALPDGALPDGALPDGGDADTSAPQNTPGAPVLRNFRVEPTSPSRIYFDSSESITGSTFTGLSVTGKTVSGISIRPDSTTGHYFTVAEAFTFFQRGRMIEYVGGSDVRDGDDVPVHAFRYQHVENHLTQPTPQRERYVTVTGAGSHDGTLGNEWTFREAVASAMPGDLVHVAAGDHGSGRYTLPRSGTADAPIVFQGYEREPNDITALYWDHADGAFDPSKMPYFNGGNRNDGQWLTCSGRDYVIVRNVQVEQYAGMVFSSSGDSQLLERLISNHLGDPADYSGVGLHTHGEDNSYLSCIVANATAVNIRIMSRSRYNLLLGCKSYCDESLEIGSQASTDYYFSNEGSYNVTKMCRIERFGDLQHHGHGYTFKDIGGEVHHNLLEDSVVINIKQAIDLNLVAYDNVIRRVTVLGDPDDTGALDGGIKLAADTHDNVFEYCELSGFRDAAVDHEASGGDHSGNRLIGCIIRDVGTLVGSAASAQSLSFIHCVIENVTSIGPGLDSSNSFTNTIFSNVAGGAPNAVYTYSNFHESFAVPSGEGNVSVDPQLDAAQKPTAATPTEITEGGTLVPGAEYDADGTERRTPVSIGAYQAADTP